MRVRLIRSTLVVGAVGLFAPACLTRPIQAGVPTTKTNFTSVLRENAVDKVDLLFSIDNSASMGDKQDYLKQAIPDLIKRLVTPNCIDTAKPGAAILGVSHDDGQCDQGKVEFPPVHDLHIGIVSSSLGPRLGDKCDPNETVGALNRHNDDHAHLLTRAGADEHALADAQPAGFLAWFPSVRENQGKTASLGAKAIVQAPDLESEFQDLVVGVHQLGCGVESQLESWYRFLVQPDPYDHVEGGKAYGDKPASWVGVDKDLLKQRHDFLRPDSLLAIIVLSDENDSEIDVRANGQTAYHFMESTWTPPRATAICEAHPEDPACMSCEFAPSKGAGDASCALTGGYHSAATDWGFDLNLRHVRMKQKYGIDPQFPIARYVTGLSAKLVPDRAGEYPPNAGSYVGKAACTNPLFAASLPDGSSTDAQALCQLAPGTRTKDLVFYAHIGGVPHELLHFTPNDPQASALTDADWVKILGKDPLHYDYSGIDPHMIESFAPRAGLADPTQPSGTDPIHGREWITDQGTHKDQNVDLQYACTFALPQPRDCSDPANTSACDCSSAGLTPGQTPPVCDATNPTLQVKAKAYPTTRELLLGKLMGDQGVVSSICPIHVTEQGAGDPLYGYRPAVSAIVDRLKGALTNQCLPQPLTQGPDGDVPCAILATLPTPGDESACDPSAGLSAPDGDTLSTFRKRAQDDWKAAGGATSGLPDPSTRPVCVIRQLLGADLVAGSCEGSKKAGWCYVTGAAAGKCAQEILFSAGTLPAGASVSLGCLESVSAATP